MPYREVSEPIAGPEAFRYDLKCRHPIAGGVFAHLGYSATRPSRSCDRSLRSGGGFAARRGVACG